MACAFVRGEKLGVAGSHAYTAPPAPQRCITGSPPGRSGCIAECDALRGSRSSWAGQTDGVIARPFNKSNLRPSDGQPRSRQEEPSAPPNAALFMIFMRKYKRQSSSPRRAWVAVAYELTTSGGYPSFALPQHPAHRQRRA
eukprot:scaffold31830_cov129-Isochrysis_galbana.AAC.6